MEPEQKTGKLKSFFIGKGAESGCPFHKMNHRIYESVAGIFRKREPLSEDQKHESRHDRK